MAKCGVNWKIVHGVRYPCVVERAMPRVNHEGDGGGQFQAPPLLGCLPVERPSSASSQRVRTDKPLQPELEGRRGNEASPGPKWRPDQAKSQPRAVHRK